VLVSSAALSLVLLGLATCGWFRSYRGGDRWQWQRQDYANTGERTETCAFVSQAGTLALLHWVGDYDWDASRGLAHAPWQYRHWPTGWSESWLLPFPPDVDVLGARLERWPELGYTSAMRVTLPYWMLCGMCAILPTAGGKTLLRNRKPTAGARQCAVCGYDLRASRGRCPECGTAIPAATGTVPS
jgi:hypothetical protein